MTKNWYRIPYAKFDYSDWYGCCDEMKHLSVFAYKKSLVGFLECWLQWMLDNEARAQLTDDEVTEWKGFIAQAKTADPLQLNTVCETVSKWMDKYQRSVFS